MGGKRRGGEGWSLSFALGRKKRKVGAYAAAHLSPTSIIWYRRKLGRKQADQAMHWPHIHGLAARDGVWLGATETESSAALWAVWIGKDLLFTPIQL